MEKMTSLLRLRMSAKDAHYGGNLVDGAHMVHLFGDVATELLIICDGDEGSQDRTSSSLRVRSQAPMRWFLLCSAD